MIDAALIFLRDRLNDALGPEPSATPLVFPQGDPSSGPTFPRDAVSLLLINLDEEKTLRGPAAYLHNRPAGAVYGDRPHLSINLTVLFVAVYTDCEDALAQLSRVIQFFQNNRVFDQQNAPSLDRRIVKLVMELLTFSFADQRNVWLSLQAAYQPSVAYRIRMLVFDDQTPVVETLTEETQADVAGSLRSGS